MHGVCHASVGTDAKGIDLKVVNTAGAVIKQHRIDKKNK